MSSVPDNFLLAEEREGFLVPAAIKQAWAAQLAILMEIDRVCKKHHIQYFADWGTFLGAVRHGGYIPWDDDMDIVMKREDYVKFMTVARLDMTEGYHVQTYDNQDDFWLFMGKVVGRNHICFEPEHLRRFHNFPYIACVDIFVMDYVHRDSEKEENRRKICKYMLGVADAIVEGSLNKDEIERDLKRIEQMSGRKMNRIADPIAMGRFLYGQVEEIFAEVPEEEADFLTQLFPWGLLGNGRYYPKEYYAKQIWLPFEFTEIPVPVAYDLMLRKRYGEYWRVVKGAAAHEYPFFEAQKKEFQKVLDFPIPEYTYDATVMSRKSAEFAQTFKGMVSTYLKELSRITLKICECILQFRNFDGVSELLQDAQQDAIELGTLIDEIKGEGTSSVALLENYCEYIFEIFESVTSADEDRILRLGSGFVEFWDVGRKEIERKILKQKNMFFLPVHATDWKYMQEEWERYARDESCDVYVVPLTYFYKDYDGSPRAEYNEIAQFPTYINARSDDSFTAGFLELIHPEEIVIQNPYDEWNEAISVREDYYARKLREYTDKLIYIAPYWLEDFDADQYCEYHNMKYYVTMPGVTWSDEIHVTSDKMKMVYVEKLTEFAGEETRTRWENVIKVYNNQGQREAELNETRIFYCVSWGCLLQYGERAIRKIRENVETFKRNPGVQVYWHMYPSAHDLPETIAVWDQFAGLRDILKGLNQAKIIDVEPSTEITYWEQMQKYVNQCTAYYGDGSPLVSMFRAQKKPIMIQNYDI